MKRIIFIVIVISFWGCDRKEEGERVDNLQNLNCRKSPTKHYAKSFENTEVGSYESLYLRAGEDLVINDSELHYSNIHTEQDSVIRLGSIDTDSIVLHVEQTCTLYGAIELGDYKGSLRIECMDDMIVQNITSEGSVSLYSGGRISIGGLIRTNGGDVTIEGEGESVALNGVISTVSTITVENGGRQWSWASGHLATAGVLTPGGAGLIITGGEIEAVGIGGVISVDNSLSEVIGSGFIVSGNNSSTENSDSGLTNCSI